MAFTASLRKILYSLLAVMTVIVMFFYWNQGLISKPNGGFFSDWDKLSKTKLVPAIQQINAPEKTWTYKCVENKCVRKHHIGDHRHEKRIPFLTCSMKCGASNIWPLPTGKTSIGLSSNNIHTSMIKLTLKTPFKSVDDLFRNSFEVFLNELKMFESNGLTSVEDERAKEREENKADVINGEEGEKMKTDSLKERLMGDLYKVDVHVNVLKSNDIYLKLDTDESYTLIVSHPEDRIHVIIAANTFFGARNGLQTLQQLIWFDDEDEVLKMMNKAHITDSPKFNYRGLMLDTSRHFFSVEAIKRTIVGMAHSKLNRLHWHITDSQSFPFVSRYYPQLAAYGAYSNKEIYRNDDVKDIVDFARVRGIQIIPEIDAPAHAGNGWDWGPKYGLGELSLCINQQPWSFYCGEPPCGQLNPKNNNTYMILQKLYSELLELTGPTDYFHLGGDEVNLDCWAQTFNDTDLRGLWCDFMLQSYDRLRLANGGLAPKVAAVWSSGLTSAPCLSKNNFAVQVWGGSTWQENFDLIEYGYRLVISHVDAWYLDCGFGSWRSTGEGACSPYRTWQNVYKHRPWDRMHLDPLKMRQILGGEACLWSEQVDEDTLDSRVWPRAASLAERLWTDPIEEHDFDSVPKEVFGRMSVFRNRLVQLGIKAEPIFPKYCSQNQNECI